MTGACFVCAGSLKILGPCKGYQYFTCGECGTVQLSPMPTGRQLEELYAREYLAQNQAEQLMTPERWKKVSKNYNEAILKVAERQKIQGPILDFGAGYGYLCQLLIENGYDCTGVELSEQKLDYCRENHMPVRKGGFEIFDEHPGEFSAVLMCAVFEHLSEHVASLKRIHGGLKRGGMIITLHPTPKIFRLLAYVFRFGDPNRELPYLDGSFAPPWHTSFVSLPAMTILAEQVGFEVCEISPAPQGRLDGLLGLVQLSLEKVNILGWAAFGGHWPLVTSHIFVLRKTA